MKRILVLGGGAAGIVAAIAAAEECRGKAEVLLLERNPRIGKKLLATGNGRCNLDNNRICIEDYFTSDRESLEQMLKVIAGLEEPTGLLCVEQPKNMEAVEAQAEDTPRDMECYVDANGNTYDFCFGLNWSGVINDERTEKYDVEVQLECESFDFKYAD